MWIYKALQKRWYRGYLAVGGRDGFSYTHILIFWRGCIFVETTAWNSNHDVLSTQTNTNPHSLTVGLRFDI